MLNKNAGPVAPLKISIPGAQRLSASLTGARAAYGASSSWTQEDQTARRSRVPNDRAYDFIELELVEKLLLLVLETPSSPASAANLITATESLFAEAINDFCNKICQLLTHAVQHTTCAGMRDGSVLWFGGSVATMASRRALRMMATDWLSR
jgi:hypothetical protein